MGEMLDKRNDIKPFWPPLWWWAVLLVIILGATPLRLVGYDYSLPYIDHPDEPNFNIAAQMMLTSGSSNPINMQGYPPGIITINYFLLRWFHNPVEPPSTVLATVRIISVVFSVGIVVVMALLGYRVSTPLAGLLAAFFVAIDPAMVENAPVGTPNSFLAFFAILGFFLSISGTRYDRDRWTVAGIVSIIAAILFKYQAVFVAPLLLMAPLWRLYALEAIRPKS